MTTVFERLVGQSAVVAELRQAAAAAWHAAAALNAPNDADLLGLDVAPVSEAPQSRASMTHAWLFTGPPGSGRSVAAKCFAAALQCQTPDELGCGHCHACTTVMAGTHGDVRHIVPEGLSLPVKLMREVVATAARRPSTGRWQVVIVEDADRLTEGAANALLKMVEEPPPRTVFLLCAPSIDPEDIAVTLRSRCRHVALTVPSVDAIAAVLTERDAVEETTARWAASVSGGHVGRARRLATDPDARRARMDALGLARAATAESTAYAAAEALVAAADAAAKAISAELDEPEREELRTALGAGGTGKGAAGALRGSAGIIKDLEKRQKSRTTRMSRDTLDLALVDLAALFRDGLAASYASPVAMMHPDMSKQSADMGAYARPEELLECIEAVLECREVLGLNVKPRFAVDAMVARIGAALAH
ncbi:DNA polymerase III subunit delta' [Williamsia sterculiae]|uniref:DNA polymerase-3 subunit delta n=1 Tax=Williamsia sterculiae TaxID=1344003 RepID=A0A1N7F326_9NOCA|nr:DNA polymerase III subunit delta' [Williamsia sterculiae]SIR94711.1 DNA polymerase-3 subunit delta' [Williamsia sterculiae]